MIERIINGIQQNWLLVGISFLLLVGGTIAAYRKHGWKRVLLGKSNDSRELVYKKGDGTVDWKPTLKSWKIIVTGGMSILTLFLILMILILSFMYALDIESNMQNNEKLCQEFGTVFPTEEQVEAYNDRNKEINLSEFEVILNEGRIRDPGSP